LLAAAFAGYAQRDELLHEPIEPDTHVPDNKPDEKLVEY
jgi:ribose transport system ATP-binding protein